ncbi:EamA family transporter [Mesorhizobium sp. NBSH29]|uniref:DMT family transporter n=1 Tax=Mesorhizobium sp. NBSH29 TaxID=2654249 RepID=UPI001896824A|nr:DMT family transporter [Mesorhizobium sp. NBSH29]QPC87237.1 EamA family transporter [Mesorhizobium sp. NBSH29]
MQKQPEKLAGQHYAGAPTSPLKGILLKIFSVAIFVAMSSFIKASGQLPAGQIVFFRSLFAVLPILVFLGFRGELSTALSTKKPINHILRGVVGVTAMMLSFFALTRLPLPEAITLNYAQPLLVVVFSALFLGEKIRFFRWGAVIVGLIGVAIISWPKMTLAGSATGLSNAEVAGVMAALAGAGVSAIAMLLVRNLVRTEKSATIVFWFSLTASAAGLLTLPFGWQALSIEQAAFLIAAGICGGIAQIFMTEAYRHAEASTVAPFEYTSMLLGIGVGYLIFGDQPTVHMLIGGTIVVMAGIFIIWRERQLGLARGAARKLVPPQG